MATRKRTLPITCGNVLVEPVSVVAERALNLLKFYSKDPITVGLYLNYAGRVNIDNASKGEGKGFVMWINKSCDPDGLAEELRYALAEMQRDVKS